MRQVNVWMPDLWMENHRGSEGPDLLVPEMRRHGVSLHGEFEDRHVHRCDLVFAGGLRVYELTRRLRKLHPGLPIVHYNWDLYPFQVNERTDPRTDRTRRARPTPNATRWAEYVEHLRNDVTEVWVPSSGVIRRTHEYCGPHVRCKVVLCNVFLWEFEEAEFGVWTQHLPQQYVVDVMREYTGEPMVGAVARACAAEGIPCVAKNHRMGWEEFKVTVANAALLVSAYNEASTGGLTLLEGYAHGVPVLISDSPMQGANEYFPGDQPNVHRFRAGDEDDLRVMIEYASKTMPRKYAHRRWVEQNYGVKAFCERLARDIRRVAG